MKTNATSRRSIWVNKDKPEIINIIDQRYLPFELKICELRYPEEIIYAISEMQVRGAPLIGVTAAFGIYLAALKEKQSPDLQIRLQKYSLQLKSSRPTAINLAMAVDMVMERLEGKENPMEIIELTFSTAVNFMNQEVDACKRIGENGLPVIEKIYSEKKGEPVQIMTHCNAGWLATVEYGTATAPIYLAHDKGIPVHVWVDETRPRNQGSRLTAWELEQHDIPCTIIADNTGGHLMQKGMVDMLITGSDRTALNGDTANKTGTYLKALAASDNNIPFYVALPLSSIDTSLEEGVRSIPVEIRNENEIHYIEGLSPEGKICKIRTSPPGSKALNYAFDITPAGLISGLITEKGIINASRKDIISLFPEMD